MALANRKRVHSTVTAEHFDYIVELSNKTQLSQSKFYDVAVELLKRELENKTIFELFEELKDKE